MVCGIIGHQYVEDEEIESKIYSTLIQIIDEQMVNTFILGSNRQFNDICFSVLKYIQSQGKNIKIVNYACQNESPVGYDQAYVIKGTDGKDKYVKRNKAIVKSSDLVLLYFDKNYKPQNRNSGTKIIYQYCREKNKKTINLLDESI